MSDTDNATPRSPRKRLLIGAAVLFVALGAAYGAYWGLVARHFESTDDAYVQGDLVQITPQIAGTVIGLHADDTDFVKAGEPLAELDRADADVALAQAEASLAQTVRQVSTLYVQNTGLAADISAREAQARSARSELARAQNDLRRRQALAKSGGVSGEELLHAQSAVQNAQAAVAAADAAIAASRATLAGNEALTSNTTVAEHPNVKLASAKVREAYLNLARTHVPAPVSGYVARRSAQLGQRVAAGAPLMAIVPLDGVWVDANFKEVQIGRMRIGQPVTLTADMYGSKVVYHGTVAGLGAGTGSAFALLPAQNASGNWIKVVQRVPVRIALDKADLDAHPLRLGLSMDVKVDISDTSGQALAQGARREPAYASEAFTQADAQASAAVARILADNGAGAPRMAAARSGE